MSTVKQTAIKVALFGLALSFPAGLLMLNAPTLKLVTDFVKKGEAPSDVSSYVNAKAGEIREIDNRILQAKGEILKFEEMRSAQVEQLKEISEKLSTIINEVSPAASVTERAQVP